MPDVVQFVPRDDRDARSNLAEFIRLAKEELTAFSAGGAWEKNKWKQGGTVVVFATKTAHLDAYSYTPMAEPFMEFAKAYVRYSFGHNPAQSWAVTSHALRCLEAALVSTPGPAEIGKLNVALMDVCAAKCREFFSSEDVQYQTGRALKKIFDFLRENRLVPSLPAWKSPFKKPVILTEHLGDAGRAYREGKLPSNESMLALADVFAQAADVEARYFSSILVLLMATPSRISEVLGLATDCLQWEEDQSGVPQMYLRWRAAKGGGATKKWVVPVMQDVVQEAVKRLIEIGKPAREAARFAFDHPGSFLSHSDCLAIPD